jgi:signal transduction histidine kinase
MRYFLPTDRENIYLITLIAGTGISSVIKTRVIKTAILAGNILALPKNNRYMKRTGFKILLSVFIFLFSIPLDTFPQKKVKNVVVFFSLSSDLQAYQMFLEGLKKSLTEHAGPNTLITEFLDISRASDEVYAKHIIDVYNRKFKDNQIDFLITFGPGLNPVLLKYGFDLLKTAPVLDIDFDTPDKVSFKDFPNQNRKELLIKDHVEKSLVSAFNLFPKNKNVFVISGSSALDTYLTSMVEKNKKEFEPEHVFKFISGISIDSTIHFARKIPANSIIFLTSFNADSNGIPFSTSEALNIISNNCSAPFFMLGDEITETGKGIGGNVYSFVLLGKEAGRIAGEMLKGIQTKDINVNDNCYTQVYNWLELKKWNLLDSKAIPEGSILFNEEISFFDKYEWYFVGLVVFLVSQTLLILYLFTLNRRQREINKHVLETENMYREIIREDRLAKMTELTASLSHELNQPLTAILYSAQAGKRFLQTGKLDLKLAEEIFDNIIEDEKRAGGIIGSVRSLMKLEAREKEKLNLNELVLETSDIIHTELVRNGIKIKLELNDNPVYVFGDKVQLQQVLMNFIRNAANAMEKTDPENKIIEILQKLNKDTVTISVRDYGHGIDDAIKDKLFKPFVTTGKQGFGIGLALSRNIIEKHKGEIRAENVSGGGARFSFSLHIVKNG